MLMRQAIPLFTLTYTCLMGEYMTNSSGFVVLKVRVRVRRVRDQTWARLYYMESFPCALCNEQSRQSTKCYGKKSSSYFCIVHCIAVSAAIVFHTKIQHRRHTCPKNHRTSFSSWGLASLDKSCENERPRYRSPRQPSHNFHGTVLTGVQNTCALNRTPSQIREGLDAIRGAMNCRMNIGVICGFNSYNILPLLRTSPKILLST